MMKKLVLGLALFCGVINAMEVHTDRVIKKSKSDSSLPVAVSMIERSAEAIRPSSAPVTAEELQHAIKITSMKQFKAITKDQAKKLKRVAFCGMEINEQFVDQFGEIFYDDLDTLTFQDCVLKDGMSYHLLFAGMYTLHHLEIKSRDLTDDDAVETFCSIYPWLLKSVVFSCDNLNRKNIFEKLRQCSALSPDGVLSF